MGINVRQGKFWCSLDVDIVLNVRDKAEAVRTGFEVPNLNAPNCKRGPLINEMMGTSPLDPDVRI